MSMKKNVILAAMGLVMAVTAATGVSAETRFDRTSPQRAEVNGRLTYETHRIGLAQRGGEIRKGRALHRRARAQMIRVQVRREAARHGGHFSRVEKLRLNREEHRLGRHAG